MAMAGIRPTILKRRSVLLMIVFSFLSFGFYLPIWYLRRRDELNRMDSPRKLQLWPFVVALAFLAFDFAANVAALPLRPAQAFGPGFGLLLTLLRWAFGILMIVQAFFTKDILEDHLQGPDDAVTSSVWAGDHKLSGLLTFFFTIFYLQHIINRDIIGPEDAWSA